MVASGWKDLGDGTLWTVKSILFITLGWQMAYSGPVLMNDQTSEIWDPKGLDVITH